MSEPYRLADRFMSDLAAEKHWPLHERLKEVECECTAIWTSGYGSRAMLAVTVEEVQKHITRLLAEVKIRALVVGNMYKDVSDLVLELGPNAHTRTGGYPANRVC